MGKPGFVVLMVFCGVSTPFVASFKTTKLMSLNVNLGSNMNTVHLHFHYADIIDVKNLKNIYT